MYTGGLLLANAEAPHRAGMFSRLSRAVARISGQPAALFGALAVILLWAVLGPVFDFSDTWQLVVNTGTTIVTFLMVFLIQNTQNRDTEAIQIKLDELIKSTEAHNTLLGIEDLDQQQLQKLRESYSRLGSKAREEADPADEIEAPTPTASEGPRSA